MTRCDDVSFVRKRENVFSPCTLNQNFRYLCNMRTIKLDTQEARKFMTDYCDEDVVLLDNIHQAEHVRGTIRAEFFLLVLVEQGQSNIVINEEEVFLKNGDLLICTPGNFIKSGMVSLNFHCRIFISSPTYTHNILKDTRLNSLQYLITSPCISLRLTSREQNIIKDYYALISAYGGFTHEELRKQCVRKLMQAFSFAVATFLLERGHIQPATTHCAADSLFRSFLRILHEHPSGRSVRYYAEKLSISPKYFNTICKQMTGKTASTLINEELVSQAKVLLGDPDLSIKQIAATLGFSNQSHFGTFMRRETGTSPQALRKGRSFG